MSDDDISPTAEPLRLDHFLKLSNASGSGGGAKLLIQSGAVKLNGAVETRRRKKLSPGDVVEVGGKRFIVPETAADQ